MRVDVYMYGVRGESADRQSPGLFSGDYHGRVGGAHGQKAEAGATCTPQKKFESQVLRTRVVLLTPCTTGLVSHWCRWYIKGSLRKCAVLELGDYQVESLCGSWSPMNLANRWRHKRAVVRWRGRRRREGGREGRREGGKDNREDWQMTIKRVKLFLCPKLYPNECGGWLAGR